MKKAYSILLLMLLLCCGVLTCGGGKTNVKNTYTKDWKAAWIEAEEKRLKELRAKVKILFPDIIKYDQISPEHFEKKWDYVFTINFSNVIYESDGKIISVPIFRGTMGDVLYDDFLKYCRSKELLRYDYIISAFQVEFGKGEFNKTLDEFKNFYGRCLSINFKKDPTKFFPSSETYGTMVYAFTLDGVEGELSFIFPYEEYKAEEIDLIYSITINK